MLKNKELARWLCTWVCKTTLANMHVQMVNARNQQRLGEGAGAERELHAPLPVRTAAWRT
eukprot:6868865-Pyramimonas_sp.AAC.1